MKLKEGIKVRLKTDIGKHKKGSIIKILYIIGMTTFVKIF